MFTICLKEFTSLFKSIRSIIIIAVLFGVTTGAAKLISQFEAQLMEFGLGDNAYVGGLMVILFLASPLFVTSLSHSVINKEVYARTIRFLATKTSRENIIIGKFLGNLLFWVACLFISLLLVIPFSHYFYYIDFIQSVIFVSYFIGLTILLSTIISNPAITMFLGITISIVLPVIGLWSIGTENIFIKGISYITPYFYYTQEETFFTYFVALFTCLFIALSLLIFRKRDL
ncbi:ABC transporter permease [Oceanobacillus halophilus]|uniref:ABC transporter permease n=1 Tax=Oceanobacillus halophilus TaxID=930130 RepID=A0A494ZV06_9BACI|nr:ABC transporter permease subunit [Oceanobacillus halophilus]RKQ30247.1 ABC transporter permease [Oceanobacillus halophilus]